MPHKVRQEVSIGWLIKETGACLFLVARFDVRCSIADIRCTLFCVLHIVVVIVDDEIGRKIQVREDLFVPPKYAVLYAPKRPRECESTAQARASVGHGGLMGYQAEERGG